MEEFVIPLNCLGSDSDSALSSTTNPNLKCSRLLQQAVPRWKLLVPIRARLFQLFKSTSRVFPILCLQNCLLNISAGAVCKSLWSCFRYWMFCVRTPLVQYKKPNGLSHVKYYPLWIFRLLIGELFRYTWKNILQMFTHIGCRQTNGN